MNNYVYCRPVVNHRWCNITHIVMSTIMFQWLRDCHLGPNVRACMLSHFTCVRLSDPMDSSPPGSSVRGILQAKILEWAAMPSSRGSSWPGIKPTFPTTLEVLVGSLSTELPRKPGAQCTQIQTVVLVYTSWVILAKSHELSKIQLFLCKILTIIPTTP